MKLGFVVLVLSQLVGCARGEHPPVALTPSAPVASSAVPVLERVPAAQATSTPTPEVDAGSATRPNTAASSLPLAPPEAFVEPDVTNRQGLGGLVAALNDVDQIELLRWKPAVKREPLAAADKDHLLQLLRVGVLTNTRTVEHPPWPAAFLFHTRHHGTYALLLVGRSTLRLDSGRSDGKFQGADARWNSSFPPEIATNRDDDWLWTYLESRLGETRVKDYLSVPPMDGVELPRRP